MPFSIYNDALSRNVQRSLAQHTGERVRLSASMASGLRINSAADDAAGQAIASRMRSSVDGLGQARRNINDAASMLQVADGALSTIGDSLQRLRELAVAAGNGSYGERDRAMLQTEGDQILARITTVGNDAAFAGKPIFRSDGSDSPPADTRRKAVLDALQAGWLGSAENLVEQYYGLTGDGATLAINLDATDGKGGVLASVDASGAPGSDLQLNVDMADFDPSGAAGTSDGGAGAL
jgi:flagellin